MPQTFVKFKNPMDDGRRRINPSKFPEIIEKYATGNYTHKELGIEYEVSKSLITIIVNPQRRKNIQERQKLVWHDYNIHYGKDYHAKSIAKNRAKKREMGLILKPTPLKVEVKACLFCGQNFKTTNKNKKYCSRSCFEKQYKKKI